MAYEGHWEYGVEYRNRCIRQLDNVRQALQKDFNDMDFENADVREDYQNILNAMFRELNKTQEEIQNYLFLENET